MKLDIEGKRALVAGSSSGIGAAIAEALAKEGAEVIIHGRDPTSAEAVRDRIVAAGGRAHIVLASLSDPAAVDDLARQALALGPIDILVNSAGAAPTINHWFTGPDDAWQQQFQLSTFYVAQLIRAIVPAMRARGWGRVINISSGAAIRGMPLHPEYAAAKLALHSMTATLAAELGDCGVTVNAIVAGGVATPNTLNNISENARLHGFTETGLAQDKRVIAEVWKAQIPLARLGRPEEVADAACFLASARASYITGATLRVDGGASGAVF